MLYKDSSTVGSRKQKMVKTELGQVLPHTDHQRGVFFSINRQDLLEFFKPFHADSTGFFHENCSAAVFDVYLV